MFNRELNSFTEQKKPSFWINYALCPGLSPYGLWMGPLKHINHFVSEMFQGETKGSASTLRGGRAGGLNAISVSVLEGGKS